MVNVKALFLTNVPDDLRITKVTPSMSVMPIPTPGSSIALLVFLYVTVTVSLSSHTDGETLNQ